MLTGPAIASRIMAFSTNHHESDCSIRMLSEMCDKMDFARLPGIHGAMKKMYCYCSSKKAATHRTHRTHRTQQIQAGIVGFATLQKQNVPSHLSLYGSMLSEGHQAQLMFTATVTVTAYLYQ